MRITRIRPKHTDAKRSYENVGAIILSVAAAAGIIAIGAVTPNALQLLRFLPSKRAAERRHYITKTVYRLIEQGYLEQSKTARGVPCVRLTKKGTQELQKYKLGEIEIKKPFRWDNRYRIIIFDIKEARRAVRDELRSWLQHLGFIRLQQSVWVHPYKCKEVISLLKAHFHIGKDVLYMEVDYLENDKWLKESFGLT